MSFFASKESFDPVKLKAMVKMAMTRVKMVQQKTLNSVKVQRKQLAELIAIGKFESARVKVESVIREDVSLEGLEVLSLFCDLIAQRAASMIAMKSCPPELKEAVTSALWASTHIDSVPELVNVRKQFMAKFGKEFVEMASNNSEFSVNQKVLDRLGLKIPTADACVEYLAAICEEFGLEVDESKLRGPAIFPSDTPMGMTGELKQGASGFSVPPIVVPRDDLEARLLALKRQ